MGKGVPDECELGATDCNLNDIPDDCDITDGTSLDCNQNGVPDECELIDNDCNMNDIPDDCDIADGTSLDCNENDIPDECDLADGTSPDCNQNTVPDECDIASGWSLDLDGNGIPDECEEWTLLDVPAAFELAQNYPNPFNPTTTIDFAVADAGQVNITIYDLSGKAVATLVEGQTPVGYHTVEFDASELSSGVYIYRLTAGDFVDSKKMVVVK
ncbi:MAG: T9SS type A sorting domain-containing protein [Candidatus Delongbacteria bacterium]|nr:T9SS type A sorting domain-containing protein [bacterium]MBL7033226.1 T9SS type A sorting domain-containing protein [Candidatus Delongbacteria bacterium]